MNQTASTMPPLLMVVEDSDEDFDTVEEAVRGCGLAVTLTRACSGDACLQLLLGDGVEAVRPSVVLMDLNTPGTDGREALKVIKSLPGLRDLPVVVHTTSANPRDLAECYQAGANAYHVKPVRYTEHRAVLQEVITYWLGRVRLPEPRSARL